MALDIRDSKRDLAERIKRRLGYPVVKVELDPQQIFDAIDYARDKWVRWAVGQATVETFFTVVLSAGKVFYDLPLGVTEIIDYYDNGAKGGIGGINTLFTLDNFLYTRDTGIYSFLWNQGYDYSFVSYHLALDFLKTIERYTPTIYNYKYHPFTNQLEVQPPPPSGNALEIKNENGNLITIDSPGFILVRSFMIEGSHYSGMETINKKGNPWRRKQDSRHSGNINENFFVSDWIFDYSLAECKIILGRIRSKFGNFASIGNTGISLDGDTLISEGTTEKERLEETLRLEEVYEGYPIFWG